MKICTRRFCDYNQYYLDQAGGKLDISYYSAPYQRGHGVFSNLAKRYALPALKYLFQHGIKLGRDLFSDLSEGKDVKESLKTGLKRRAAEGLKDFGEKVADKLSGSGLRKKPRLNIKRKSKSKRKIKSKTKRNKKSSNQRSRDIFN